MLATAGQLFPYPFLIGSLGILWDRNRELGSYLVTPGQSCVSWDFLVLVDGTGRITELSG